MGSTVVRADDAPVRAADAAVFAAAALLPAEREPVTGVAATPAGARSGADIGATGQLIVRASEIHRYTGVP